MTRYLHHRFILPSSHGHLLTAIVRLKHVVLLVNLLWLQNDASYCWLALSGQSTRLMEIMVPNCPLRSSIQLTITLSLCTSEFETLHFFATVLHQRNCLETQLLCVSSFGIVLVSIRRWVTSWVDGKHVTTNENTCLEKGAGWWVGIPATLS